MKIATKIGYPDMRYPTAKSKHKKLLQHEELVEVELREATLSERVPAFIINQPRKPQVTVYYINGRLFVQALAKDVNFAAPRYEDALVALKRYCETTPLFCDYGYEQGRIPRLNMIAKAQAALSRYLVVNTSLSAEAPSYILMREVPEPLYCVEAIGSGNGEGGTIMYPTFDGNRNLHQNQFFSALDREWAIKYANELARSRGDTEDISTFMATIEVLKEDECVWPRRDQNGNLREFLPY